MSPLLSTKVEEGTDRMAPEQFGRGLGSRLRARRPEIERAALARIQAVSDSREGSDPEYRDGLRAAVSAALGYGIEALELSEDHPAPIPTALLSQARLAARYSVKLETVLRRYLAGYTLLGDFIIAESDGGGMTDGANLKRLLRVQATVFDRLVAAVSEEYTREARARPGSAMQRRLRRVEQLLAGEQLNTSEFAYDFDSIHLGLVASGADAMERICALGRAIDSRALIVQRDERTVWAWFGTRRRIDPGEFDSHVRRVASSVSVALGEPGKGPLGWQLTHRQAKAAASVGRDVDSVVVRYADVALLASYRQDDVLAASMEQLYLAPLAKSPGGGAILRETLRAYFATGRNVSSAAASLSVHRRTVSNRIRAVEKLVGRRLEDCAADIEVALQMDELS
jgi:hypothetical protein